MLGEMRNTLWKNETEARRFELKYAAYILFS